MRADFDLIIVDQRSHVANVAFDHRAAESGFKHVLDRVAERTEQLVRRLIEPAQIVRIEDDAGAVGVAKGHAKAEDRLKRSRGRRIQVPITCTVT